ncbi:hypothetical protein DFH06DRAFT_1308924 [Mycena polygramma]|nr:hypothetical protein DFH06DRAFT_1308924 [Mycena polygramma]
MAAKAIYLGVLVILNITLALLGLYAGKHSMRGQPDGFTDYTTADYSYKEHDYPLQLLTEGFGHVAMSLQASSRFGLNLSDETSTDEWGAMLEGVKGYGRLRLGPERRLFVVTWFHQLHCLWEITNGLLDQSDPDATVHHLTHCFTYLRQTLLCDANGSLEEGDFITQNNHEETHFVGESIVCHDWNAIHARMDTNFEDFEEWRKEWL